MNATNKGVAIAGGRVIRGTQDGFLFALDAKTGRPSGCARSPTGAIGEGIGAAPIVLERHRLCGQGGRGLGHPRANDGIQVRDGTLAWSSISSRSPATSRAPTHGRTPRSAVTAAARPG